MRYGKRNWKRFTLKEETQKAQGHGHPSFQETEGGREMRCTHFVNRKLTSAGRMSKNCGKPIFINI